MTTCKKIVSPLTVLALLLTLLPLTSCSMAGGRRASDWKGMWYREGDLPFSRCYAEITNVNREGFDFTITVYNGNKAGEMENCHASFEKKTAVYLAEDPEYDENNKQFFDDSVNKDEGIVARYYAEDPRSYIEFGFEDNDSDQLNISFCTTGDGVEWTAFPDAFQQDAQITGLYSREESYINDSLYAMGVIPQSTDSTLQRLMGDKVYFRLVCCFQNYTAERSDTTGSNLPYEYDGSVHMHDGIGGTIYYGSMVGQQYAACVIAYDDGSVSAAVSLENGSVSYYSDNWVYEKQQPYPILIWVENYTKEQNGEFAIGES